MDLTEFRGVLAKIESIRRKARFNKPEDLDIDEIDPIWGWEKYDIRHCTQDLKYMKGMIQRSQDENVKKYIVDFIMAEIAINHMNTNDIRQFYNAVDLDGTWGLKDASMESYLKFLGLMALSIPGYTGIKADVPESKSKEAYSSLKENLVSLCQDITNPKERNYLLTQVIPLGFDAGTDQKIVQLAQQSGDGLSAEQRIAIRNEVDFYHYNRHFLPYNQPEIVAMVRSLRKNLADMGQDYNKPLSEIVEEFRKEQGKFYPAIKKIDPSNMFYRDGQVLDCHYLFIKDSAGQVLYNVVRAGTPEGAKAALEAIRDMDPDLRLDCVSGCMPALRREKETADKLMEVWSELNGQITSKPEIIDKMGYLPFDNRLTQRLIESRANSEYEECHGENGTITRLTRMNKSRKR